MAKTRIEWTGTWHPEKKIFIPGYTFNPWWGCILRSPGCANCYAMHQSASMSQRFPQYENINIWGKDAPRRIQSDSYWEKPLNWNRHAKNLGIRLKVFCASMADLFEDYQPIEQMDNLPDGYVYGIESQRERFWELTRITPYLDYLVLTKRAENLAWRPFGNYWPENIWLMVSAENQKLFNERVPLLAAENSIAKGISFEPLIGPIDTSTFIDEEQVNNNNWWFVVGAESEQGPEKVARIMLPSWESTIRESAHKLSIPYHFKQWGAYGIVSSDEKLSTDIVGENIIPYHEAIKRNGKGIKYFSTQDGQAMKKMGKANTGRLINGRVYNDYPGFKIPLVSRGL